MSVDDIQPPSDVSALVAEMREELAEARAALDASGDNAAAAVLALRTRAEAAEAVNARLTDALNDAFKISETAAGTWDVPDREMCERTLDFRQKYADLRRQLCPRPSHTIEKEEGR